MSTQAGSQNEAFTLRVSREVVENVISALKDYFAGEDAKQYSKSAISDALRTWLERRFDVLAEDLAELLTAPGRGEAIEFKQILDQSLAEDFVNPLVASAESSVFTGFRPFSAERLGAMASYIASRGKDIYKTKLNKLLFYSDFINFYLHGHSISGAKYIHVPFGPVPEHYGDVLAHLSDTGRLALQPVGEGVLITQKSGSVGELAPEEIETIEWVLDNYGRMTSTEISDLSHQEKAYRFTRPGEEIAYRYAALFDLLPHEE